MMIGTLALVVPRELSARRVDGVLLDLYLPVLINVPFRNSSIAV